MRLDVEQCVQQYIMNHIRLQEKFDVRRDLREGVTIYVTENIKPNFAEIARQYNVDYRTVKKAYEETKTGLAGGRPNGRPKRPSLLDPFRQTIDSKLELNCSAASIFKFIQKKGFIGSYSHPEQ